ncbi:uncharacterized protein LOC121563487 isoform X1 [Coregonus clupeaformis]|uniref:uncharacterized protein LOC121563487 isoform X1 n=1 Tax=Coregonus clupeaformis TaxID=59861 RepID=UPI001E1C6985|nr:uncharacterized protein LOC121563487 isoform X1 [Coregonus clupeaformis]
MPKKYNKVNSSLLTEQIHILTMPVRLQCMKMYSLFEPLNVSKDGEMSDAEEEKTFLHSVEDTDKDNLTVTETGEETNTPEKPAHDEGHKRPDMDIEEDGRYFNRNKDNQLSSKTPEEIQRGPQTILENILDMGLSVDMDHPPSGSLESPVTDFHEEEQSGSSFVSVLILSGSLVTLFYEYLGIYGVMVSYFMYFSLMNGLAFLL